MQLTKCSRSTEYFFKSLKVNYNRAADSWMTSNPGKRITFFEMAGLFQVAYNRAATVEKAVTGFRVTGIWPFNDDIFSDEDFAAAEVTEEPEPDRASATTSIPTVLIQTATPSIDADRQVRIRGFSAF